MAFSKAIVLVFMQLERLQKEHKRLILICGTNFASLLALAS